MGVRRGGQEGSLAPPPPHPLVGQNSMFFDFFERKGMFFRQLSGK